MSTAPRAVTTTPAASSRLISLLPPVLTLALAVGYVGLDVSGSFAEHVPGAVSPLARGGIVALQAVALLARHRAPIAVFAVVVLLDLVLLSTSAGELGTGAFAVMIGVFVLARTVPRRAAYTAIVLGAAATVIVSIVAGAASVGLTPLDVLLVALVRAVVQYVIPAAIGEYLLGRERLGDALRERAELVERERLERAERELRAGRAALARELHDIAGHHLSGIIVSAQAASALTRSDPERARETLQALQEDARTALADLRRTVGLLRHDDRTDDATRAAPVPTPSIDRIGALVEESRARGLDVRFELEGEPRPLGPLAETAGYRMAQESLANAARHAPGASVDVSVRFADDAVTLAVRNTAAVADRSGGSDRSDAATTGERYGLAGMEERAGLIRARLTAGPTPDGGWANTLVIPSALDGARS